MSDERVQTLGGLAETWLGRHGGGRAGPIEVVRADVLRPGRPGLLDLVVDVDGRQAHLVAGLRNIGDEPHFLRAAESVALGMLYDENGPAVCTDALRDAQLASLLLATVRGVEPRPTPGAVAIVRDDLDVAELDCGDWGDLMVFQWLSSSPRPDVDLLMALDEAGFNHVAAPLVRWMWEGRDLGVVLEPLVDRSSGWALALTSLRDLYAAGGPPDAAGGDFGGEARALGRMTARMHLALDHAFWHHTEPVGDWVVSAEEEIAASDPSLLEAPGIADLIKWIRESDVRLPVIRTHGDFHLGRTARTDHGWVVSDCAPGGVLPGARSPGLRTPLGDVADMLWSMHQASATVAAERDPTGRQGLEVLGQAWETRNRRSFVAGYLGTAGIRGLVGSDRDLVGRLVSFLELARSVRASRASGSL